MPSRTIFRPHQNHQVTLAIIVLVTMSTIIVIQIMPTVRTMATENVLAMYQKQVYQSQQSSHWLSEPSLVPLLEWFFFQLQFWRLVMNLVSFIIQVSPMQSHLPIQLVDSDHFILAYGLRYYEMFPIQVCTLCSIRYSRITWYYHRPGHFHNQAIRSQVLSSFVQSQPQLWPQVSLIPLMWSRHGFRSELLKVTLTEGVVWKEKVASRIVSKVSWMKMDGKDSVPESHHESWDDPSCLDLRGLYLNELRVDQVSISRHLVVMRLW